MEQKIAERRLAMQQELSRILSEALTVESAARRVLSAVAASLGCVVSELWVLDRTRDELNCAATWSAGGLDAGPLEHAAETSTFRRGQGLPGLVLQEGTPQWMRDVSTDPKFRRPEEARRLGLRTAIAFPVRFGGETTGVIQFLDREAREPDQELLRIFEDVGNQIGMFLERVTIAELVRRQSRELLELSTPVLRIWDRVLLVPLIGAFDSSRAEHAKDRIVESVVETGARVVLLDVTGVSHMDTAISQFLIDTIRATRLVGARVILTGVRAALAQTLIRVGIGLDEVESTSKLADGLRQALVGQGVTPSA